MNIYLIIIISIVFFSNTAWAGAKFSAHFCQVVGSSSQVAYHSSGTLIALQNGVRVSCPISGPYLSDVGSANLHFNSRGGQINLQNYIKCSLNKINMADQATTGSPRAARIRTLDILRLEHIEGPGSVISANIHCTLQRGVKILGYQTF